MKWALVLSGGGAKGLTYIGMLQAFEELKLAKPNLIVGCSMGAIIGGLYASGMSLVQLKTFFNEDFGLEKYFGNHQIPIPSSPFFKFLRFSTDIPNLFMGKGLDSGEKARLLFSRLTNYSAFNQTEIPFLCNATDLYSGKEIILKDGPLAPAFRASSSFPGVFAPMPLNNQLLIDGCISHNTPVWIAKKYNFKNILAVTVDSFKTYTKKDLPNSRSILFRTLDIALWQPKLTPADIPTAELKLHTPASSFDFSNPQKIIDFGYKRTMQQQELLQAFFKQGLSGIFSKYMLKKHTKEVYSV